MWNILISKRVFICFAIALALVITSLTISYYYKNLYSAKKYVKNFNSVLRGVYEDIEQEIDKLLFIPEQSFFTNRLHKDFSEQGITFIVYHKNKLVFWSNNATSIDYEYDATIFNREFIQIGNNYYLTRTKINNDYVYIGLLLIKRNNLTENEYINNEFNQYFKLPSETQIGFSPSGNDIVNEKGDYLFSLILPEKKELTERLEIIMLILYLAALILIIVGLFSFYRSLNKIYKNTNWIFAIFITNVILLRAAFFYFRIPGALYETKLFGPTFLATSVYLPSLGDLIVNAFVLLVVSWYFYRHFVFSFKSDISIISKLFIGITCIFHIYFFFFIYQEIFNRIVFDSVISFDLRNIFGLTIQSFIGFLAIAALMLAFFFLSARLCTFVLILFPGRRYYILLTTLTTVVILIFDIIRSQFQPVITLSILIFIISFLFSGKMKIKIFSLSRIIMYLVLFALITTYTLQTRNTRKENTERKLIALDLAANRDRIAEYRFHRIEKAIYNDLDLSNTLNKVYENPENERFVIDYILEKYFDSFWNKFEIQVTICYPGKELQIRPGTYIIGCSTYFENYIRSFGEPTACESLFYIFPGVNYISRLNHIQNSDGFKYLIVIYIEFISKKATKGLGYPELLSNEDSHISQDIFNYSYATYVNKELVSSVGKYPYSLNNRELPDDQSMFICFDHNNYNHLLYNTNSNTQLVVSIPKPDFLDLLAPFSYLFIFFALFVLIFSLLAGINNLFLIATISFRNRIQFSILGIVLVSFLIIGISTLFYIVRLNNNKNLNVLSEKNHSVLIELEHKLAEYNELNDDIRDYLDDLLTKFSLVFFSDINLYDPKGWLIASSRPQIFEEGLISGRMNPEAYLQLAHYNKSSFIHNESIGSYNYLSAYLPFRNNNNKLIGYVNLPYFARQNELRQEISSFLVAFTNIYVVLMAFGLFLALILSDYLLRPLMILKENLRKVKLSEITNKIEWKGKDEISELIAEYNRMTEEIVKSAELLTRSERERAWMEMAKQVAHEIKNPLTPMKLSVQYLQKAWNEKSSDWDNRLARFTQIITQQIDSLSEIATAFSDFATMPTGAHDKINIIEIINNSAALYTDLESACINISSYTDAPECYVLADKKQMLRTFNNLIQNAVQAIDNNQKGIINISILKENDQWCVIIQDNGTGIKPEQQKKIFSPNFTTKSSGMGLGLAIVKNIVTSIGGSISFTSEEQIGTTFKLLFPIYSEVPEEK